MFSNQKFVKGSSHTIKGIKISWLAQTCPCWLQFVPVRSAADMGGLSHRFRQFFWVWHRSLTSKDFKRQNLQVLERLPPLHAAAWCSHPAIPRCDFALQCLRRTMLGREPLQTTGKACWKVSCKNLIQTFLARVLCEHVKCVLTEGLTRGIGKHVLGRCCVRLYFARVFRRSAFYWCTYLTRVSNKRLANIFWKRVTHTHTSVCQESFAKVFHKSVR